MDFDSKHTFKNFNSFNKPNPMQLTHGVHPHSPYNLANKLRYKQKMQNKKINYVISSYLNPLKLILNRVSKRKTLAVRAWALHFVLFCLTGPK